MTFSNLQINLEALPDVAAIEIVPIERSYAHANTTICAVVSTFVVLLVSVLSFVVDPDAQGILRTVSVCGTVVAAVAIPYTYRYCKNIGYALRQHDFILVKGVFFFSQTVQPLGRIQHVELKRGPIDKRLGLTSLKVFSAGQGKETFAVPGLRVDDAQRLRATILDYHE